MKILAITPAFAPQIGGIEMVVEELAKRLIAMGHQVDIAHVHTTHSALRTEQHDGLTVHRVPLHGHRLLGLAPALGLLSKGYDLLHVHDPQLMALTASVRLFAGGVPAVLSTHGGFHHTRQLSWFKTCFERIALRGMLAHYRAVLASSVADEAYFQTYSDRVVLCNNGVATDKFGVVPSSLDRKLDRWIYWGRLSRNKRVDQLIDTVALAHRHGMPIDLLICGRDFDGIAAQLKAQVVRLGLEQHVHFEAHMDDAALLCALHERGVYVTASEHEGFGLSVVEALAAGLMVLCRDMTPLNTFVQAKGNGGFLSFDNADADVATLKWLQCLDEAGRTEARCQARAVAGAYSWDHAAKRFEGVLLSQQAVVR